MINSNIQIIIISIISYLIGSIPFAIIISKLMNIQDPRTYGSNNPGATNVLRSGKKLAALLTFIGDAFKGWVLVYLITKFNFSYAIICISALFVIIGHMYSIFLNFKGGKGVATAIGVLLALSYPIAIVLTIVWVIVAIITKTSSFASIIAFAVIVPISAYFIFIMNSNSNKNIFFYTTLIISILIIYRHKTNIINLINGNEKNFKK